MLVRHLPADSAIRRATDQRGESLWGLQEQLLAAAVDALRGGNWQRGAGKGERPKPIPRPGTERKARRHFGRPDRPPHEVAAYLARFKPPPPEPKPYPHGR